MRRGARLCAAGLLAATLAVGGAASAIVTPAYAEEQAQGTITIKDDGTGTTYSTIDAAIEAAKPGDTIKLGAGTYNITTRIAKAVNFEGAGADVTTIHGQILYGNGTFETASGDNQSLEVSNLTIEYSKEVLPGADTGIILNGANVSTLSVNNVTIENFKFGINLNGKTENCAVNASGLKVSGVWCAIGIQETGGNKLGDFALSSDSTATYAVQGFGDRNGYYPTVDEYSQDTEKTNNNGNSITMPATGATESYSYVATVGYTRYANLQDAFDAANPGDTVYLAAGEINLSDYPSMRVNVHKPLTIVGSDKGTTIKGALWVTGYDSADATDSTVTLSNIDFVYLEGCSNQGVCVNDPDVRRLNVEGCSFTDYVFAIGNGGTRNFTLAATNVTMKNVWCGVGFQKFADSVQNTLESFKVTDGSTIVYEVQGFGSTDKTTTHNGYYINYEDYVADEDNTNNNGLGGESASIVPPKAAVGSVPTYAEQNSYEATLNGFPYESVEDAVAAAKDGDTITLTKDVSLTKMLTISTPNVTLDLGNHTISGPATVDGDDTATTNDNHLIDVTANGVTITNGKLVAGAGNNHTLNVWNADGVTIDNVTLDNSKAGMGGAPLIVGASDVKVTGTLNVVTGGNSWYGINVDSRYLDADKTNPKDGNLTFGEGATANFAGISKTGVYLEETAGLPVDVTFEPNATISSSIDGFVPVVRAASATDSTVTNPENAGIGVSDDGTFHVHQGTFHEAVAPTCTEDGTVAYYQCDECGKRFSDPNMTQELASIVDPATGHDVDNAIYHAYKAPTATESGNIEYWECPTCHALFYDAALKNEITAADAVVIAPSEEPVELYTVTFKFGTGEDDLVIQVPEGQAVYAPKDPTYDGFTFLAWYTDEGLTEKYDFSKPVTGDLTLYAGWLKNGVDGAAATTPEASKADAGKSGLAQTSDPTTFLPAVVAAAAGVTTVAGAAVLRKRQR